MNRSKHEEPDPTNRFYIGTPFLVKNDNDTETVVVPESVLKSPPPPPPPPPEDFPENPREIKPAKSVGAAEHSFKIKADDLMDAPFPPTLLVNDQMRDGASHLQIVNASTDESGKYCKLCDISVTSEMHMRLHLVGAKHAKKLRQLGEPPYADVPHTLSQCILEETTAKRPKHINTVTANAVVASSAAVASDGGANAVDYSVFRTPSGQYYCQMCDLSVTSEVTLAQHFASKRHIKSIKRK